MAYTTLLHIIYIRVNGNYFQMKFRAWSCKLKIEKT
jgi:hypothetical protein